MPELDSIPELDEFGKELLENEINPVSLHPDLEPFVFRSPPDSKLGWDMLKHPLVFGIPYIPATNFIYNKQYKAKTKAVNEAVVQENWNQYIYMHERPHRFDALEAILGFNKLSGQQYWELLGGVWSDSENLWQVGYKRLKRLLALYPEHRDSFMEDHEKKFLQRLPDRFRVFRGHQHQNQAGFSWTLSFVTARWFGQRFASEGCGKVSEGIVQKKNIIGLIMGRNELEIVVDPRHVKNLRVVKLVLGSPELNQLKKELLGQFRLKGRTDHGGDHWDKVSRNGMELCQLVPDADREVVGLFAIFHDSCRRNENDDPKHGHRAADLVNRMYRDGKLLGITEDQLTKLEYACRHHNGSGPVSDPTIGVCFDSDRLDLLRVGIIPDPKLLSTKAAEELIGLI